MHLLLCEALFFFVAEAVSSGGHTDGPTEEGCGQEEDQKGPPDLSFPGGPGRAHARSMHILTHEQTHIQADRVRVLRPREEEEEVVRGEGRGGGGRRT